jgi:hypothetical protein
MQTLRPDVHLQGCLYRRHAEVTSRHQVLLKLRPNKAANANSVISLSTTALTDCRGRTA